MGSARHTSIRRPRSLTPKGLKTRASLLDAARQVFEEQGYFRASVSEMGRRCGVSQGTFYQYFNNKDQVFRELIDDILDHFWQRAEALSLDHSGFEEGLRAIIALLLDHTRENAAFHRVLNEFELIDTITIGYYDSIARYYRNFFRQATNSGHIRALDPNVVAYALIGIASFHFMDWGEEVESYEAEELVDLTLDFLLHGVNGPKPWERPSDLTATSFSDLSEGELQWEESHTPGKRTRRAIFQAAEQVIGRYGYSRANISEITRRAGVAQGTFYIHFESKEALMQGVVRYLSREMRRELRQTTDRVADYREKERQGMLAFFRFLTMHSQIYRVVAESETIGREAALWYYRKLAKGYTESLIQGMERGEIRRLPPPFLAHTLMGLNHMIGLKWLVWNSSPNAEIPRQVAGDAIDLALFGLSSTQ